VRKINTLARARWVWCRSGEQTPTSWHCWPTWTSTSRRRPAQFSGAGVTMKRRTSPDYRQCPLVPFCTRNLATNSRRFSLPWPICDWMSTLGSRLVSLWRHVWQKKTRTIAIGDQFCWRDDVKKWVVGLLWWKKRNRTRWEWVAGDTNWSWVCWWCFENLKSKIILFSK